MSHKKIIGTAKIVFGIVLGKNELQFFPPFQSGPDTSAAKAGRDGSINTKPPPIKFVSVNDYSSSSRIEDARSIAYVQVESWKTTYVGIVAETYLASLSPESRTYSWKEQFDGATLILVAEDEAGVFGFVSGGALRDPIAGYDGELYAIYLLQQKQREGVGRTLVRKLADALRGKGYRSLIVWVLERNPSLGFYTRLGGTVVSKKEIQIGGAQFTEVALGWSDIADLS